MRAWMALLSVCMIAVATEVGCGRGDAQVASLRNQFVLAEEPQGAVGIAEVPEGLDPEQEIVVVGRIASGEFDPWAKDQASFVMSETLPGADGHAHAAGHDPASCPFCRRRAEKASATALVQFHDAKGAVLPIDARKLLGVTDNAVVVVRGKGEVNDVGMLVIAAEGIHVRR